MKNCIRLGCRECDTDECDDVDLIPATWTDVVEVQSLDESQVEVSANDRSRSLTEWYTHLGLCPTCQKEEA